jgi:hypothetical protein
LWFDEIYARTYDAHFAARADHSLSTSAPRAGPDILPEHRRSAQQKTWEFNVGAVIGPDATVLMAEMPLSG